jgi:pimeloyl-ACP methyl ester carboxylesterase
VRIVASIVGSVGLLVVLFNAVLYGCRAAVLRRTPACDADDPLGLVDAVRAFVGECLAIAAVVLLVPIGWVMGGCRSATGTRGPVILVHGWALNAGSFWLLRRRLLRDGWSPIYCFPYASLGAKVEPAAERLRAFVQQISTGAAAKRPLTLVGHSLGGLVVRYFVRRYPAPAVRRIVTLGTPHCGTELARVIAPLGRQLAPQSALLSTLNAADRVPQQFDVIAIHSSFDALILPPINARYAGAFNVQVNNVGHNALLFSARVYELLRENLAAPLA